MSCMDERRIAMSSLLLAIRKHTRSKVRLCIMGRRLVYVPRTRQELTIGRLNLPIMPSRLFVHSSCAANESV